MHSLSALAFATAAYGAVLDTRQTTAPGNCATGVHVIAAGGGNSPDPTAIGRLGSLAQLVVSRIPGSDFVSLPYDKQEIAPQKLRPNSIPDGIQTFGRYVSEYTASCPNSKLVFLGYSSGAVITMQALRMGVVPQSLAGSTVVANIAYGEQTFVPGQAYDAGTCTNGEGTQPATNPAALGAYIPITQSYSDMNDPQSCSGPPEDYEIHLSYPGKYDNIAAQYVVNKYNQAGGGSGSASSSSSSSASPSSMTNAAGSSTATGSVIGGGLPGVSSAASSMTSSMTGSSISVSSATATATIMPTSMVFSTAPSESSAASSIAAVGGAVSSVASSAGDVATSAAVSGAAAVTSLAPYDPNNAGASLVPASALINAACVGGLVLLGAALF